MISLNLFNYIMETCQKKHCPIALKKEKLNYEKEIEKCKKMLTDYKRQTLKKYTKCSQKAYSVIAKINKRTEKCLRKNCNQQLNKQSKKVRKIFGFTI